MAIALPILLEPIPLNSMFGSLVREVSLIARQNTILMVASLSLVALLWWLKATALFDG